MKINTKIAKCEVDRFFIFNLLFLLLLSCNGGSGGEDAQQKEVEEVDVTEEQIGPEEAEDFQDLTDTENFEVPQACATKAISCSGRGYGEVRQASQDGTNLDKYIIYGRPLEYSEEGSEYVFFFETEEELIVTLQINSYTSGNLDIIVLKNSCQPQSAIAFGDSVVSFVAKPGETYYIAIDGRNGSTGNFELILYCSDKIERCGNNIDDDDDGFIDCNDTDCMATPPCWELFCDDGLDDDNDGKIDCRDFDCIGAVSCSGGPGEIGDPCTSHADCQTGKCYMEVETGWPGGYCIQVSKILTCEDIECPPETECEPIGFVSVTGPWACAKECSETNPCRPGYLCEDHLCFPLCTDAEHCTIAGYCEYDHGLCTTVPTEICSGNVDEDDDGDVDCDDTDCMFKETCVTSIHLEGGDTCREAAQIPVPSGERGTVVVTGTTEFSADDYLPSCEHIDSSDVVYFFTITVPSRVRIDLVGGKVEPRIQDTIVYLRHDCEGEDLACNNDIREGVYYHSFIDTTLQPGSYYIIVDGFDGLSGDFTLGLNLSD